MSARHAEYESARDRGQALIGSGDATGALPHFERACQLAESLGGELRDRAFCNRAAVLVSLERGDEVLPGLREILVRSQDGVNCRLAAYSIGRVYELRKDYKKGLFYARIARNYCAGIEEVDATWSSSTCNQLGNFLVAESRFEEAAAIYRQALEADSGLPPFRAAMIRGNLGYCHMVAGRFTEGFRDAFWSLRVFRRHRAEKEMATAHLDLAFGYLEIGRHRRAVDHARTALAMAERLASSELSTNSLYLLGEGLQLIGDEAGARRQFGRLQAAFPGTPFLTDFLLAVDVRRMVNLRA